MFLYDKTRIVERQEKEIIRLLLRYGRNTIHLKENEKIRVDEFIINVLRNDEYTKKLNNNLYHLILTEYAEGHTDESYFVNHTNDAVREVVTPLLFDGPKVSRIYFRGMENDISDKEKKILEQSAIEKANLDELVLKALVHYKISILELLRIQKKETLDTLEKNNASEEKIDTLIAEINEISKVIIQLTKEYGFLK